MINAISIFGLLCVIELLAWQNVFWQLRKYLASALLVLVPLSTAYLIFRYPSVWTVFLGIASIYRMLNFLKVIVARIQIEYLHVSVERTSFSLIFSQFLLIIIYGFIHKFSINQSNVWLILALVEMVSAIILLIITRENIRISKIKRSDSAIANKNLPSLTVAIPARNETIDLEECLESLIASNYPKLEIIVLDDCSQSKQTPQIIKRYAQEGVRFVAGNEPPKNWLAKNFAYDKLADEANGDLLLFCGVDTRFSPDSLQKIVTVIMNSNKSMVSILPRNEISGSNSILSKITQSNRYAWELCLPRWLMLRPPVLSTCWLINKAELIKNGGFESVRRKVIPERYFAISSFLEKKYDFITSNDDMGLLSKKSFSDQLATSVRVRYPQLHKRPENVFLISILEFIQLISPVFLIIYGIASLNTLITVVAAASWLLNMLAYSTVYSLAYRKRSILGLVLQIFAITYDIAVLNYSMWRYEFKQVIWKDRNICLPVMHYETSKNK